MPSLRRFLPPIALLTALACGGSDPVSPPPPIPARLEVISGADQRGNALEQLPEDIGIRVLDDDGHALAGATLTLAVVDGEGTLSAQQATSDALGAVRVRWTLGPRTGEQHLRAFVAGDPSVEAAITATARPQLVASLQGASLVLVSPENGNVRTIFSQFSPRQPTWSPDGRRIAFIGRSTNSIRDCVYVVNVDGSGATPITTVTDSITDMDVDWSPDGRHLVFTRLDSSRTRVFVVDPDGRNLAQLTSLPSSMPRWSPDGKQIAFSVRSSAFAFPEIAVMNADGSGIRTLTANDTEDGTPDWSPDGAHLVYYGWREGRPRLFVINVDGTGDRLLSTDVPADHLYDGDPAWSRDGTLIAFSRGVSSSDGSSYTSVLYTVHPDGTALTAVPSGSTTPLFGARWRP